jgi:hypothetical protein
MTFGEIVKTAGDALSPGADITFFIWKLCSGITHGDFWTTPGAAQMAKLPGAPPGTGAFKIAANVKILMYVTTRHAHDQPGLALVRPTLTPALLRGSFRESA